MLFRKIYFGLSILAFVPISLGQSPYNPIARGSRHPESVLGYFVEPEDFGRAPVCGPESYAREIYWDWDKFDMNNLKFPQNFLFGAGTSEYQVSGATNCPDCQWAHFERKTNFLGHSVIERNENSGKAADHWNLYPKDIELMQDLGLSAYRFSIEWSKIEPREGCFDESALNHYEDLIDKLLEKNIEPFITLYHFTHPEWFEQKHGFECEENISYFVRFCKHVFKRFRHKVKFWLTINEPGCLVFQGYVRSAFPPAKTNLTLAGTVTKNLMHAHVSTYQALKKLDCYAGTENESQIGLAHNIVQFEAYTKTSNLEKNISNYINHIFHESITNFLKTKKFVFDSRIGYLGNIIGERITWEPELKNNEKILDFIGLNYYSHMLFSLSWPFESRLRPGEYPTEMPYGIYPEGIYRAICQIAELGVPIYITENGIADAKDSRREFFLKRYLLAVSQAIREGYDVRGYFYWSLLDNFEWDMGFEKRFGLYAVDYKTQERILRPSALFYKNVIEKARNFNNTCDLLQVFNHTHLAFSKNHLNKLNNPYIYHLNQ